MGPMGGPGSSTDHALTLFDGTSGALLKELADGLGAAGEFLKSQGAGSEPVWDTPATGGGNATIGESVRLSVVSGTPVPVADQTAKTTVYVTAGSLNLWDGSAWTATAISELSKAVPATTDTWYAVYVDYNSGTPQIVLEAWTDSANRATAIAWENGNPYQTGTKAYCHLGDFRTTSSSGETEDSDKRRLVWNQRNRRPRNVRVEPTTASWSGG